MLFILFYRFLLTREKKSWKNLTCIKAFSKYKILNKIYLFNNLNYYYLLVIFIEILIIVRFLLQL